MTKAIYPLARAAITAKHAGGKYRPSNGTEGLIFVEAWCAHCARDKAMREGAPLEECDDNEVCSIIAATHRYDVDDPEYPTEWQYGHDGQPCCTAFAEEGQPAPMPRCTKTMDLF